MLQQDVQTETQPICWCLGGGTMIQDRELSCAISEKVLSRLATLTASNLSGKSNVINFKFVKFKQNIESRNTDYLRIRKNPIYAKPTLLTI